MKPESTDSTTRHGDDLDWARHANATDEILAGLEYRAKQRRVRRVVVGSALVVALAGGIFWPMRPSRETSAEHLAAASHTVTVIPPRSEVLPDGSVVELKDGAEIKVNYAETFRRVDLLSGAAHFAVAKNPARPFIVSARGVAVRAVGTAFAVDSSAPAIEVIVTEGKVAVETSSAPGSHSHAEPEVLASLSMGHRTVVRPGSLAAEIEKLDEMTLSENLSWRIPRIEFSQTPLDQVVAELNKHNRTQLVLADDSIRQFRISGALRADRLDALADLLATDFGIEASRSANRIVLQRGR